MAFRATERRRRPTPPRPEPQGFGKIERREPFGEEPFGAAEPFLGQGAGELGQPGDPGDLGRTRGVLERSESWAPEALSLASLAIGLAPGGLPTLASLATSLAARMARTDRAKAKAVVDQMDQLEAAISRGEGRGVDIGFGPGKSGFHGELGFTDPQGRVGSPGIASLGSPTSDPFAGFESSAGPNIGAGGISAEDAAAGVTAETGSGPLGGFGTAVGPEGTWGGTQESGGYGVGGGADSSGGGFGGFGTAAESDAAASFGGAEGVDGGSSTGGGGEAFHHGGYVRGPDPRRQGEDVRATLQEGEYVLPRGFEKVERNRKLKRLTMDFED